MSDNLTKRDLDGWRINVNETWEVDYWTNRLGITADELRQAVQKVGVMANDVRQYLGLEIPERYSNKTR